MCLYDNVLCDTKCEIYKYFKQNRQCLDLLTHNSFSLKICDNILIEFTRELIFNLKNLSAIHNYICQGYFLLAEERNFKLFEIIGVNTYLDLCIACLDAIVVQGAAYTHDQRTIKVLDHYKIVLETNEKALTKKSYADYESKYVLLFMQINQSKKNVESYGLAVRAFDEWKDSSIEISEEQMLRNSAQNTCCLYLFGKKERQAKFITKSRDKIYDIYDSLQTDGLDSLHYFVMAKMIEHHTETCSYSEITDVVKQLDKVIEKSLTDEVFSVVEAVNKVIFHRDVYRAYRMIGDVRCIRHLKIAEEIAKDKNLTDQLDKIKEIKNEWQNAELYNDKEVKDMIDSFSSFHSKKHKCNLKEPYIFISYSHKNSDIVRLDLLRDLSGVNYWVDFENLDGGRCESESDWTEKVIPVLKNDLCKGVIVYCSPYSVSRSIGALREAEWLEKNRSREIYVFLCGFDQGLTPDIAAEYLDNLDVSDPSLNLRIKVAFEYILQATQSNEKYSYYFYSINGKHLTSPDFTNWLDRILEKNDDS